MAIVIPPGLQRAVSGEAAFDQFNFGAGLDNLLALRQKEQESAQNLFNTIARANPRLASFVISNTNLSETLTKTPSTLPKKGEVPLGVQVQNAFRDTQKTISPSMLMEPGDFGRMSLSFAERFAEARLADPTLPEISDSQFQVFMSSLVDTNDFQQAFSTAGISETDGGKFLTSAQGQALGMGARYVELLKGSGATPAEQQAALESALTGGDQTANENIITGLNIQLRQADLERTLLALQQAQQGKPLTPAEQQKVFDNLIATQADIAEINQVKDSLDGFMSGEINTDDFGILMQGLDFQMRMAGTRSTLVNIIAQLARGLRTGVIKSPDDINPDIFVQLDGRLRQFTNALAQQKRAFQSQRALGSETVDDPLPEAEAAPPPASADPVSEDQQILDEAINLMRRSYQENASDFDTETEGE